MSVTDYVPPTMHCQTCDVLYPTGQGEFWYCPTCGSAVFLCDQDKDDYVGPLCVHCVRGDVV